MKTLLVIGLFFSQLVSAQEPKGSIIYNSKQDGNFEVYTMNPDGSNPKNISNHPKTDYAFCSSENGKSIYFYSNRDGNDEIYKMNLDGLKVENISNHPSSDRVPEISKNEKWLAFQSDRDEKSGEIYLMNLESKNIIRLTNNNLYEESPCFSSNGKKILFTRQIKEKKDTLEVSNGEIFIMDLKTKKEIRLTNKDGFDSGAKFSPNQKQIAFYGKDEITGNYDIFIMNADGTNLTNLTNDVLEDYSPTWSPEGSWLAFTRGNAENYDVWIINIHTKELRRLTTQPKRDESPFWIN
ncbi:TolB family protein [Flavobacterium sp.]|uniref:TolB family protein n=1 Tax=Flavobacterium sp. TaxID=239 RepID=UPI004047CC8E